jgi:hypothetical protein
MATPKQVRAELKRRKLPQTIHKDGGTWYVAGPGLDFCMETALMVFTFDGNTAGFWVDIIEDMVAESANQESKFIARAKKDPAFEAWCCETF